MTVEELASYLHVSRVTAYTLAGREDFPSFRVGRRILIDARGLMNGLPTAARGNE